MAATPAAASRSSDDAPVVRADNLGTVDFTVPLLGRIHFTIPRIPYQDEILQFMDYVDTKIPRIMGKPALRECLANIKPGMTVALVSLPLSISLAIAADAQPVQGVITAVWAGIVSAIAGGSHFNIVGPTGALSGILSFYQLKYPIVGILPLMAILSGFLALLVWVSRMDSYLVFIPGAVMHGFTLGVAFIIAANQLNFLLGLPPPCPKGTDPHHPPPNCLLRHPEFIANLYETFRNVGKTSLFAICFFAASFAALFNLANKYGKVPWAVLLAIAGILVGWAVEGTALPLQTIKSRYKNLSIQLVAMLDSSQLPTMDVDTVSDLFRGSVSICAVAVLETLISARIADRMTKTIFDQPREVLSVGLANLASGLTGGIPATAALARTALNVKTGATSRGSGIVSAVMIMLLSSVLFSAFQYLPLPVVATILVNTAYRMVEWHEIHLLMDTDRPMMVVCIVTMIICAVQDPTMGIVYGTGFSMIRVLLALMHGHSHLYVFQGTLIELSTEFKLNNGADSVPVVRRRFLKEVDPVEVEKEKQRIKAAEAVTSSANAIAAAASALRIAEEDSRATAQALVAAASGKASSVKTRKALNATMQTSGGTDALAASAAAAAINTVDDAPEFLKGMPAAPEDARLPKVAVYEMPGYCTYVGAKSHLDRIRGLFVNKATCLPGIDVVAFSMEECKYADPDALEAMGDVVMEMSRERKTVFLLGLSPVMQRLVAKVPWSANVVHFEDYPSLLLNMREALRLDEERHSLGEAGADGAGVPSLAEMVVRRVRDITVTGGSVASAVTAASGDAGAMATPRAAAQPNAGGGGGEAQSQPRTADEWS